MITRKDYLDNNQEPGAHRAYYAQFVTDHEKTIVQRYIGMRDLRADAGDPNLNGVALGRWDRLPAVSVEAAKRLKEAGDYLTLGGKVCIYKEAARQLLEADG